MKPGDCLRDVDPEFARLVSALKSNEPQRSAIDKTLSALAAGAAVSPLSASLAPRPIRRTWAWVGLGVTVLALTSAGYEWSRDDAASASAGVAPTARDRSAFGHAGRRTSHRGARVVGEGRGSSPGSRRVGKAEAARGSVSEGHGEGARGRLLPRRARSRRAHSQAALSRRSRGVSSVDSTPTARSTLKVHSCRRSQRCASKRSRPPERAPRREPRGASSFRSTRRARTPAACAPCSTGRSNETSLLRGEARHEQRHSNCLRSPDRISAPHRFVRPRDGVRGWPHGGVRGAR